MITLPRIPNKVLINCLTFDGDAFSMHNAFEAGEGLGREMIDIEGGKIKGNVLLKEDADLHLAEQESICADLDAMMEDCIKRQRALNDKRRKWLDTKL